MATKRSPSARNSECRLLTSCATLAMSTLSAWRLNVSSERAATRASRRVLICSKRCRLLISVPSGCQLPHSSITSLTVCFGSNSANARPTGP